MQPVVPFVVLDIARGPRLLKGTAEALPDEGMSFVLFATVIAVGVIIAAMADAVCR